MSGIFLTFMPVVSKVIDAVTNIVMGRIIDKTHSRQGKVRPWIAVSGVMMAVSGILLYAVPKASPTVQIIWVVFSYNLFFAFAFTIYNMSHALMVPLSTRNTKQRDTLALLTSTGATMIPGMLVTVIMPVLIAVIGVGIEAQSRWLTMMGILSAMLIPATLVEYFFTKERVTEDAMAAGETAKNSSVSLMKQMKACLQDPYWMIVTGFSLPIRFSISYRPTP